MSPTPLEANARLYEAQGDHERATWEYLRACGWRHTSNTIGCLWLWVRKFPDGMLYAVSASTALHMSRYLGEGSLEPDESDGGE